MTTDYWVTLTRDGRTYGAGFLFTQRYVLTAAHVLRRVAVGERVQVRRGDETVEAVVLEVDARRDVAVVVLLGTLDHTDLPTLDQGSKDDNWLSPYLPQAGASELKGVVLTCRPDFESHTGGRVEALELEVRQQLGAFNGYSGGPVARDDASAPRRVIGMLIEQQQHRVRPDEAANVLFAVTADEATRSELFQVPTQQRRLRGTGDTPAEPTPDEPDDQPKAVAQRAYSLARAAADEIRAMCEDGYLSAADAQDMLRENIRAAGTRTMEAGRHVARTH